jgi:hypothetical protein
VAYGQHTNYLAEFVDLVDDAVDMRLFAVVQMTQRSLGLFAFGCDGTAAGKTLEAVDGLLAPVVPARTGNGFGGVDPAVDISRGRVRLEGLAQRRMRRFWRISSNTACRTGTAAGHIVQALANRLEDTGASGDIKQVLISFCVLDDGLRLAVKRQDNRSLARFEMLEELTGFAAERGKGLNVLGDIEHENSFLFDSTLRGAITMPWRPALSTAVLDDVLLRGADGLAVCQPGRTG